MGRELKDLKILAKKVAKKQPPANFTQQDAENAFRAELRELAKDYNTYRRNKLTIFELIQDVVDEVLPNRVIDIMGRFAEVRQFAQGQKPIFKAKLGQHRYKRFITQVGLSGIYETGRLDREYIEVPVRAYGGAAVIELERYLDGIENIDELMDIILLGLEDAVYKEVMDALLANVSNMPVPNVVSTPTFDGDEMVKLINICRAYGGNANIFCPPEFAATVTPSAGFHANILQNYAGSPTEQDEMRNQGYIGVFRGGRLIVLPQSFEYVDNTEKVINPGLAYVIPSGGQADERIAKVAMEGGAIVDDYKNADRSMEIQIYKKFGVAILTSNYYCMYQNLEAYTEDDGWSDTPIVYPY